MRSTQDEGWSIRSDAHSPNLLPGEGGFSELPSLREFRKDGCGLCGKKRPTSVTLRVTPFSRRCKHLPGEGGFSVVPPRRNYGKDGCGAFFCRNNPHPSFDKNAFAFSSKSTFPQGKVFAGAHRYLLRNPGLHQRPSNQRFDSPS